MGISSVSHRHLYRHLIGIGMGIACKKNRFALRAIGSEIAIEVSLVSHRHLYRHLIGIGIGIASVSVSVSHRYRYRYLIGIGMGI